MNSNYDTLTIKIEADSGKAKTSIDKLSSSLENLEKIAKSLEIKAIIEVKKLLQDIAKIDFSNVSKGLQDVVSAFKAFSSKKFEKAFSGAGISGENIEAGKIKNELVAIEDEYKKYGEAQAEAFSGEGVAIKKQVTVIDLLRQALSELNVDEVKIKEIVNATRAEMKKFNGVELSNVAKILRSFGFEAENVIGIISHLKELGDIQFTFTPPQPIKNVKFDPPTSYLNTLKEIKVVTGEIAQYTYSIPQPIKNVKFDPPTSYLDTLKGIKVITPEMAEAQRKYNGELEQLKSLGLNATQIESIFKALNQETKTLDATQLKQVTKLLKQMGYSDKQIKAVAKSLGELENGGKKGANGLKKIINQFKNIMKYRIIRKIIQEVYKALTEGIKNVAEFDAGVNDSLSRLTSAFQFLKNSIGAMLAPLIQVVEPLLTELTMLAGDLGNSFAEIFAGANGQTQFSKAEYDLKKFNEEAKKTQSLGIDELNVISQEDKGGFVTADVDLVKDENDLASSLKDLLSNISGLVKEIFKAFKDLVNKVLPAVSRLLQPISKIIGVILDLITTLVDETFDDVNGSLTSFVDAIASIFNFVAQIVKDFAPTLTQLVMVISSVLNIINTVLGGNFEFVSDIFKLLTPIIHALNFVVLPVLNVILAVVTTIFKVVEGIVKSLVDLVTFNWGDLGNVWADVGKGIEDAWKRMGEGNASIYGYTNGGFPEDGLFMANHNELVGQFSNGQTAVANNAQITEGIYQAVLQAMKESGANHDVIVNLDGQELARIVTKKQNNFGNDLVAGGNVVWGK